MMHAAVEPEASARHQTAVHRFILDNLLLQKSEMPTGLYDAMHYVLDAPGKYFRACLCFAVCSIRPILSDADILPLAAAIELLHAYSLVHDDLPAMDNDDYRRGQLSCHKVFGESTAILVGDALQALAFRLLARSDWRVAPEDKLAIIAQLAEAVGATGMVGGQFADLAAEGHTIPLDTLVAIHQCKTGALIHGCVSASARASQLPASIQVLLSQYGQHAGLLFQIQNDMSEVLPHHTRDSDKRQKKSTYPRIAGILKTQEAIRQLTAALEHILNAIGPGSEYLRSLTAQFLASKE